MSVPSKRNQQWLQPSLGHILGCGLADFHPPNQDKTPLRGANRLYAILMSKAAHLIWKIRCTFRIEEGSDPSKIRTAEQVRTMWVNTINRRLRFDCLMTDRFRYGNKALRRSLVEKTWWGVLRDQESLQDDWITTTKVLVGIGTRPLGGTADSSAAIAESHTTQNQSVPLNSRLKAFPWVE
ncbi:hypothetical protein CVT26_016030 [Gymnopilus dilepis]|uniref:Uncharacterized protein n=1 Tax=Gymnopilus dilepis TaxID=231916 RepID=A0A409YDT1_9AGAR|nr:hypothetical protein CVT26_016030 [Gymnopilus dilepis]